MRGNHDFCYYLVRLFVYVYSSIGYSGLLYKPARLPACEAILDSCRGLAELENYIGAIGNQGDLAISQHGREPNMNNMTIMLVVVRVIAMT